jgi:FlaA1/EpsC-like NDP-sugar epimerase
MVVHALEHAWGGELFVPKIPSYKLTDVAKAIGPNCKQQVVGIRPGEKVHEEMITESDSFFNYDLGKYYVVLPAVTTWKLDDFVRETKAVQVNQGFKYNSGENREWVSVDELRRLIREHVDPAFELK